MRIKRIVVPIIAGLLLLMLILPQLSLAAPKISSVTVSDITEASAEISWTTNTTSDSRVNYGTTTALGMTVYASSNSTIHNIVLTGLIANKKYFFEVKSADASGTSTDNNGGVYYSFTTLAPATYSIILDPVCGVCGDLIEVGICGEVIGVMAVVAAPGTYYICWDSATSANVKGTFTATTAGGYSLVIYTPEATKGNHTVHLANSTYASKASATFEVLPSVKIDPEEGPAGTVVTLNGYGFTASQDVRVSFLGTVKTGKANTVGSWNITHTIPNTPAGGYTFEIEAKEGTVWVNWVSKYFEVTPQITATPSSGTVGSSVEVKGTGFGNKEGDIEVTFNGAVLKKNIYADKDGSWKVVLAVPPLQGGLYIIDASGKLTRARDVPDVEFVVSAGILVEPSPAYIGDTITVTGGGFAPGETGIKVTFEGTVVATGITAEIDGSWESSFVLPSSTYGSHDVKASGDITKPEVKNTITVKASIESLSSNEGAPGDTITLTGNGFGGTKKLTVTIGAIAATENLQSQYNGNVAISFRVPKGVNIGKQTLKVDDGAGAISEKDFTVKNKVLTSPSTISPQDSTSRSGMVTFKWQGITGDDGITYTLEISETTAFTNISRSIPDIEEVSYQLTEDKALDKGTYYWRVKAIDDYGNQSNWSSPSSFSVSPIPTSVWVILGVVVLTVLMVVAYRETKFKVTE